MQIQFDSNNGVLNTNVKSKNVSKEKLSENLFVKCFFNASILQ